jgi:type II secretion system protein N
MTSDRLRTLRRLGGTAAFGLLVFLVSLVLSFPYGRIKEQIVAIASTQGIDLNVGAVGPAFGLGLRLKDVEVRTRSEPGKRPTRVEIPSATVGLSLLAQMRGELAIDLSLDALDGEIDAEIRHRKERSVVKLQSERISLAALPGVKDAINLPLGGQIDLAMDMRFPRSRNAEAAGFLDWKCRVCVIGDGKEKLKIAGNPLLAEGLSLPRVRLGDFAGKITFEKGLGRLQGVKARSPDGEVQIEGEVRLADPVSQSYLDLYVRFKFSDALLKSSDKLQLMMQITEPMGKRPDGFYGFRISGSLSHLGPIQWAKTSPFTASAGGGARPGSLKGGAAFPPKPETSPRAAPSDPGRPAPSAPQGEPMPAEGNLVDPLTDPNANLPTYATEPPADRRGSEE